MNATPEILPPDAEREALITMLLDRAERFRPAGIDGKNWDALIGTVLMDVLRRMRVMSARQLAVLLAEEANRHERWTLHEPPDYGPREA